MFTVQETGMEKELSCDSLCWKTHPQRQLRDMKALISHACFAACINYVAGFFELEGLYVAIIITTMNISISSVSSVGSVMSRLFATIACMPGLCPSPTRSL